MDIFADYMVRPDISLLDKVKIQAQVLVPVLRQLRRELGPDTANRIVADALRAWSKETFANIAAGIVASPRDKWWAMYKAMAEVSGKEVDFEIKRKDSEALDIDVSACKFAAFFHSASHHANSRFAMSISSSGEYGIISASSASRSA